MAASLRTAGTTLVPGLGLESVASPISISRILDAKLNGRILPSVVGTKVQPAVTAAAGSINHGFSSGIT